MLAREDLSPRCQQVWQLLAKGHSEKEIATAMAVSVHTAHSHVKTLFKQVGVHSRGEFMAAIIEELEIELRMMQDRLRCR